MNGFRSHEKGGYIKPMINEEEYTVDVRLYLFGKGKELGDMNAVQYKETAKKKAIKLAEQNIGKRIYVFQLISYFIATDGEIIEVPATNAIRKKEPHDRL